MGKKGEFCVNVMTGIVLDFPEQRGFLCGKAI